MAPAPASSMSRILYNRRRHAACPGEAPRRTEREWPGARNGCHLQLLRRRGPQSPTSLPEREVVHQPPTNAGGAHAQLVFPRTLQMKKRGNPVERLPLDHARLCQRNKSVTTPMHKLTISNCGTLRQRPSTNTTSPRFVVHEERDRQACGSSPPPAHREHGNNPGIRSVTHLEPKWLEPQPTHQGLRPTRN